MGKHSKTQRPSTMRTTATVKYSRSEEGKEGEEKPKANALDRQRK